MKKRHSIRGSRAFVFAMIALQIVFAGGPTLLNVSYAQVADSASTSTVATSTATTDTAVADATTTAADTTAATTDLTTDTVLATSSASTVSDATTTDAAATTTDATTTDTGTAVDATSSDTTVSATTTDATTTVATTTNDAPSDTTVVLDTATTTAATTTNADVINVTNATSTSDAATSTATTTEASITDAPLTGGTTSGSATTTATTTDATTTQTSGSGNGNGGGSSKNTKNASVASAAVATTLTTDQPKYSVGENVVLTGAGFLASATVTISIARPDHATDVLDATSDASGAFTANYAPNPAPAGRYKATAGDGANSASASFTEADNIGYNKAVYNKGTTAPDDTTGSWTTGNAGSNYLEDQWAYYQYQITGITGAVPNFDVTFNHYQQNTDAIFIDAFANFRACLDCNQNDPAEVHTSGPMTGMLLDNVPYPSSSNIGYWIPLSVTTSSATSSYAISEVNDPFVNGVCGGASTETPTAPAQFHCFHINGSQLAQDVAQTSTLSGGPHTITIFYAAHLAATFAWASGNENLLGDASSIYYVKPWPADMPNATAYGTDVYSGWGGVTHNGVGSATGSSRHFTIDNQTAGSNGGLALPIPTVPLPTGSITITKVTSPTSTTGVLFNFGGDLGLFSLDTDPSTPTSSSITFDNLPPGDYTVSEDQEPAGWSFGGVVCNPAQSSSSAQSVTISLSSGTIACTFTNTLQQAHLTLVKNVVNDNGGTASSTAWTLSASGTTPISGVSGSSAVTDAAVQPGTYSLSESGGPSGYASSTYSCSTNGGGAVSGNSVTLAAGDNATCTITNNDIAPHLTLVKVVSNTHGGTATSTDWMLTASGPTTISGAGGVESTSSFSAGTYTLSETSTVTGYTASSWSCVGDVQNSGDQITIGLNQSSTCTITNSDQAAQLTVIKHVVNDDGGTATAGQWTMNVSSTNPSMSSFPGAESPGTTITLDAGSYSVTESGGPGGYVESTSTDCTGTIALGESKTCTITNDDQPAHLTLIKDVVNDDGGTATSTDWTLSATGATTTISGATGDAAVTDATVDAGTYELSESGPGNYASSSWSCVGGTQNSSTSITLGLNESSTCTITNNDIGPTLKLVKDVVNDNGGTATSSDWTLSATAAAPNDGRNFSYPGGTDTFEPVYAGVDYVLAETSTVTGYTEGAWSCDGGTLTSSTLSLGLNEQVTCTITNTAQPATLIVKKIVINDNGGTATAGKFSFQVNGGASTTFLQNASNTLLAENDLTVDAGTYNVTEPSVAGYSTSYDNCSDIVIPNGGTATCTVTNNDIGPSLTLVKVVENNYGGTATSTDWTLYADGPTPISGAGGAVSTSSFSAGTYTLSESAGPSGYASSSWSCGGGSQDGNTITLGLNESSTCTITNSDIQPQLTVIKHVVNEHGGTASSTDFTMNVDGTNVSSSSFPGEESPGVTVTLDAGSYSVTESGGPSGYTEATSTDCTGTIAVGETKTCTITNSDNPGTLIVHKVTLPANNTTTFSITLSSPPESGSSARDLSTATDTVYTVSAGTYSVTEASTTGWSETGNTCSDVVVPNGGTETCTITNTKLAQFTLVKDTVGGDGTFSFPMTGTDLPASTTLTTASGTASTTFANLTPGTYSVDETVPTGWHLASAFCGGAVPGVASAWYSSYNPGDPISLDPGEEVTCTFTDNKPQARITLTPLTAYNAVGMDHVVTATVETNDGDGNWGPAATGTIVSFSLLNNNAGASFVSPSTCATDASGSCSITINATSTGSVDIHATSSPVVTGVTLDVATDGQGENSGNAVKTYENARITIDPTATNEVGDPHTFTVTVQDDTGSGFAGVSGLHPVVTVAPAPASTTDNCATTGTNASGTCTVVINSDVAGIFTAWASTTITLNGVDFNLATDGQGENSGPATKTYVDGSIALSPLTATNAIGADHTITAHVTQNDGSGVTDVSGATVTFGVTSGLATFDGPSSCSTDASGTCSIQIISGSTGSNTVDASTTFSVGGVSLTRATDGNYGPDGTGSASKEYVNATISIVPSGTNEVGAPHTFTVTVDQDTGSGLAGVAGVYPVVTISPTPASTTDDCASVGTNASGTCMVTIDSFTSGLYTASATLDLTVDGVVFHLITNGENGNSEPATKTYVDAQILISSSSVNEVGNPHTFTVTVNKNTGDGSGFVAAVGETVASSISGTGSIVGGTCISGVTDASGECTIVVSSTVSGVATVHASTTVDVGGVSVTRSTGDNVSGDSPDSTKTWVDANISLTPASATDPIADNHILTAHVNVDGGSGFANAPDGTVIDFSIVSGPGSLSSSTCTTAGGTGSCTTTLTSLTPGTTTVNASTDVTVGGLSLSRATGDAKAGDSSDAEKTWVAGGLTVTKVVSGLADVVGSSTISQDFDVTVTGPSYPTGTVLTFHLLNGVLQAPTSSTLSPLIPGDYSVTEADAGAAWNEVVPTSSIAVLANTTSTATVTNVYLPGSLSVTKSLALDDYPFPSTVTADFDVAVTGPSYPSGTTLTFHVASGTLTNSPQTLDNLIPGDYAVVESDPGIAWTATGASSTVTVNPQSSAGDAVTNTLNQPHTTISLMPSVYETSIGGNVTLTISDENDGQVPLTDPSVVLTYGTPTTTINLNASSTYFTSGDTNHNGVMDVGETWTWTVTLDIYTDTTFSVAGHGYDVFGNDIAPETGYTSEGDSVLVKAIGATRTQGFWSTHLSFTSNIFQNYVGGYIDLGYTQISTTSEMMGIFWANNAKNSDGSKRSALGQARETVAQQAIAAILNSVLPKGQPLPSGVTTSSIASILGGTDINAIRNLGSVLDAYNNYGDSIALDASLLPTGKADPKAAKALADIPFADTL